MATTKVANWVEEVYVFRIASTSSLLWLSTLFTLRESESECVCVYMCVDVCVFMCETSNVWGMVREREKAAKTQDRILCTT